MVAALDTLGRWLSSLAAHSRSLRTHTRGRLPRDLKSLQDALGEELGGAALLELWDACPDRMERLERSFLRAQQVLPPDEKAYADLLVRSVVRTACGLLPTNVRHEETHVGEGQAEPIKALLGDRVEEVAGYVQRREQSLARRAYLRGLFWWLLLTLVLLLAIWGIGWLVVPRFRLIGGASET